MAANKFTVSTTQTGTKESGDRRASAWKTAGPFHYRYDEQIDGRTLRCGEKERLCALIRDNSDDETRCAAMYVAMKLGIFEALPAAKEALSKGLGSEHVRCSYALAEMYLGIKQKDDSSPLVSGQLITLLRMCDSKEPVERRFARIVLEKAEIKYGTVTG